MKRYILSAITIVSLFITSCANDFLLQDNPSSLTFEQNYQDIHDCESGLVAVYNALKNQSIITFVEDNLRSDLAIEGQSNRTDFDNPAHLQTFNDVLQAPNNKWQALYAGVARSNQLLKGIDLVRPTISDETELEKLTAIEAQAYLFRGLFYFYLHSGFNEGSVPIFDYVPVGVDDLFQPLASSDKVQKFFRDDLQKAIDLGIPAHWKSNKDKGKLTLGVAQALLGMSYLYEEDYNNAAVYFKSIIDDDESLVSTKNRTH